MKKPAGDRWRTIIGVLLFASLLFSLIFMVVNLIRAPAHVDESLPYEKIKSDYVLIVAQCSLAILVMFLPALIEHKWKVDIPNFMYILYFVFLFCAVFLGEVQNFYYVVPHWDTILHAFSGVMLGALGFTLVEMLDDAKSVHLELSPFFIAFFAFCFALAAGVVWELYEFTMDSVLSLNMQKYAHQGGALKIGRDALMDTMKDLVVDTLGALATSIVGYILLKRKKLHAQSQDAQAS